MIRQHKKPTYQIIKVAQQLMRSYTDANSDGFNIAVQPAARAGATFHVAINRGQFLMHNINHIISLAIKDIQSAIDIVDNVSASISYASKLIRI